MNKPPSNSDQPQSEQPAKDSPSDAPQVSAKTTTMKPAGILSKTRDLSISLFQSLIGGLAALRAPLNRGMHAFMGSKALSRWRGPLMRGLRITIVASILAFITFQVGSLCFVRVVPGTIGVKQVDWGAGSGIEAIDHAPGLYFSLPGMHTWHTIDARTQVVSFGWESEGMEHPILELRTGQGNAVQVAATVPYAVIPDEGHLIVADGRKLGAELRIKATVERVLQSELARLEVVEYWDTGARQRLCANALEVLNSELLTHHVQAEGILISGVYFPNTFEKKQQEEQLASQTTRTDAVLHTLKMQQQKNAFVAQELDREVRSLEAKLEIELAAAREKAQYGIEKQKVQNQTRKHELTLAKNEFLAQLGRDLELLEKAELKQQSEQKQQNAKAAHTLAEQVRAQDQALQQAFEGERLEQGGVRLASQRRVNVLEERALLSEEQELSATLALELAQESVRLEAQIVALERAAQAEQGLIMQEALSAVALLDAEGQEALRSAAALHDELHAGILNSPGGRIYLAQEAARNLTIQRVTLNASDPGVPSVLDLDALVDLLMGSGD